MKRKLFSLSAAPPSGFDATPPEKKDLLVNCVGIHADSLGQANSMIEPYIKRIYGVIVTPAENISISPLGPNLWHVTYPGMMKDEIENFTLTYLDLMIHVFEASEENSAVLIEYRECRELLNSTRIGYNEAADKLMANLKEIRLLRDYLSSIIDSMPSTIIGINPGLEITLWNKQAEIDSGIHKKDAEGRLLHEIYPFSLQYLDLIESSLENQHVSKKVKTSRVVGNETVYENITVFPLVSLELEGAVILIDNVTELVRLEQNLAQSRKMDAIGQLAGGIAHDFNNMLGGILGSADLLMTKVDDRNRKFVDIIIDSAEKAAELTRRLLIFGHKGSIEISSLDVSTVISETIKILERTIDKKISISFEDKARNAYVEGNSSMLQNLFLNLGINAGHAMPDGGDIIIKIRNTELDSSSYLYTQFNLSPGPFVEIIFRDTGGGIPPENLEHIFEPFFSTKKTGKGAGLGLASVYKTIREHKGAISVFSEVSKGTEFSIYFPVSANRERRPESRREIITGSGTVLLIDDEKNIRLSVGEMLEQLQYSVLSASNGPEGVNIYEHNQQEIVLVLLDMIMPMMNGYDTLLKLREINSEVKIVISSGYTKEKDMELLQEAGINGFIRKPYRLEELSWILSGALEECSD